MALKPIHDSLGLCFQPLWNVYVRHGAREHLQVYNEREERGNGGWRGCGRTNAKRQERKVHCSGRSAGNIPC